MEIDSPLRSDLFPVSRRRCEGFDEVEDTPLWMKYMVPSHTSNSLVPEDTTSFLDTVEFSPMVSDTRDVNIPLEEETEEIPLWMRCLPNNKILPKAHTILPIGRHVISMSDEGPSARKKITIRKSLNAFGPTSDHAVTVEKMIQATKRKRSIDDTDEDQKMEESHSTDTTEGEEATKRRYLRTTRQRTVNISEAAELFSIVNL